MSDTLRNQLLNLGFKPPEPERKERPKSGKPQPAGRGDKRDERRDGKRAGSRDGKAAPSSRPSADQRQGKRGQRQRPARTQEEIDLARAYALRAQREKEERIAAEAARQEEARRRREARARLAEFVKDRTLNTADADIARHFPYGGKIKRVYVTTEQLRALNAGELGVLQLDGRYLLVDAGTLAEAEAIYPQAVALKVDPDAPAGDDPYSDPQYQVPDDLVW